MFLGYNSTYCAVYLRYGLNIGDSTPCDANNCMEYKGHDCSAEAEASSVLEHVTLRRQAEVERRMGLLTMTTTYIGMAVCLLSTLLSYSSLSVIPRVTPLNAGQTFASNARTEAEKKRAMKRWYHSF